MASTGNGQKSVKHAIIDKTNTTIFITISVAVFLVVFCLFASRALLSQSFYQQKVISEKKEALEVLEENKKTIEELKLTYASFATEPINVIGGSPTGTGPKDGDNTKLVLDALPSEYDYPGLSSSVEKILVEGGYLIESIGGAEDPSLSSGGTSTIPTTEVSNTESATSSDVDASSVSDTTTPSAPIEIPYPVSIVADPQKTYEFLQLLERSIRPFYVNSIEFTSEGTNLNTRLELKTFYLPPSGLVVTKKVIE